VSEKILRQNVIKSLRSLDPISVENPAYPGTPDVNYGGEEGEGWIELKHLIKWPPHDHIVKIEHFTPQQRVWLFRRWHYGGRCCLILQVGREWLIYRGEVASCHVGRVKQEELLELAAHHWQTQPKPQELKKMILSI